uniref:Bardet-Biedl syndrome 1 N-terminal domain-containing protein n=1 Tax=Panagrolaimus davidi TaxID=227884 RepID=A0A914QZE9_9BILA
MEGNSSIKRVSLATIHYPKSATGNQESEFLTPKKWVRLLFEPDTGIVSIKDCVSTNDITGDGDHKLVIVDFAETQCRLKLLKGLNFITDAHLPDEPAGVVTFYSEDSQMPCVAVAIGNSLLIYRNMKPYYRCNVDPVDLNPTEISLWTAAMEKQIGVGTLVEGLSNLRKTDSITKMSWKSQYFLSLPNLQLQEETLSQLISNSAAKLNLTNVFITCLTTMKRNLNNDKCPDIIVIGTELGAIYCIDSSAFNVVFHTVIEGTPDKIVCIGEYDSEWRFFIALREGDCIILRKKPSDTKINKTNLNLRNYVTAICQTRTQVVIASRDNKLIFCSHKGKKQSEKMLSETIIDLEAFYYRPRLYSGAMVVFRNRIDLYIDGQIVDSMKFDSPIKWVKYGKMGREESVLIVGHQGLF